jgi:hypothetical protein
MKKRIIAVMLGLSVLLTSFGAGNNMTVAYAQGAEYTAMQDVYYTKDNCVVYAEPTYTSTVLTTMKANLPVKVIGSYSNGWYRIDIGVICYVKMDSLTTAGALGLSITDSQTMAAKATADELGYQFVEISLNKEKKIKKDVFNSYIGQKVILYAKVDDEFGISFKMLYDDKVDSDISLAFTKVTSTGTTGERVVTYVLDEPTQLYGQVAIYQFKEGYDKAVTFFPISISDGAYIEMNTYYTEFSEFAYAPVTQVASIMLTEEEVSFSLTDNQRTINADHRKGIKYLSDDQKVYRNSITNKLRKDTEYVDYNY